MKSYCIYITFKTPQALHKAHNNNIKALNFILGNSETVLEDARENAVTYINNYLNNLDVTTPYITNQVSMTPITEKDWKLKPEGYFCTEEPCHWKLTVWKKNIIKGYLFNSFEIEEIFHIDILQVFNETCQETPTKFKGIINFENFENDEKVLEKVKPIQKRQSLPCKMVRFGNVINELKDKIQNGVKLSSIDNVSHSTSDFDSDDDTANSDASEKLVSEDDEYTYY